MTDNPELKKLMDKIEEAKANLELRFLNDQLEKIPEETRVEVVKAKAAAELLRISKKTQNESHQEKETLCKQAFLNVWIGTGTCVLVVLIVFVFLATEDHVTGKECATMLGIIAVWSVAMVGVIGLLGFGRARSRDD